MNAVTKFGRKKEKWEIDPSVFCERGGILEASSMGWAIRRLSASEFEELARLCDPAQDSLIQVDIDGCTISHGNVGSQDIRYDWSK